MYKAFFGLNETPFSIAPNPDYLFMSDRHKEALAHLMFGLRETGGFVLLTGEVGTGKTTMSRCLMQQLSDNTQVACILNPTLSEHELLASICDEFHIRNDKNNTLKELTDKIRDYLLQNHHLEIATLLIIDEAQHLRSEVLEQLRLLTNLETNTKKLLQVILIGQPELQDLLRQQELRQLAQRITARYHLLPLTFNESAVYVMHRLKVAGRIQPLFTKAAIEELHTLSKGIPRVINLLCDRALLGAYSAQASHVDRKFVTQAGVEALGLELENKPSVMQKCLSIFAGRSPKLSYAEQPKSRIVVWLLALLVITASYFTYFTGFDYFTDFINYQADIKTATAVPTTETEQPSKDKEDKEDKAEIDLINQARDISTHFSALIKHWDIQESTLGDQPCEMLTTWSMSCYWLNTDLAELTVLNHPALLQMNDQQGDFYAVLYALKNDFYYLQLANKKIQVDKTWLQRYWHGKAVIAWLPPENFRGPISENSDEQAAQWLEDTLAYVLSSTPRKVTRLDPQLKRQLHQFQRNIGLAITPYADEISIIALQQRVNGFSPSLNE